MSLRFRQGRASRCGTIYRPRHECAGASFIGEGGNDEFRTRLNPDNCEPCKRTCYMTAAELWAADST